MKYVVLILLLTGCTTVPKFKYVTLDQMNCRPALKGNSARQLSELTEMEKFVAENSKECGVIFQKVRVRTDRIRSYSPGYSIVMWRNEEHADDPNGPLHIQKYNVEHCILALASPEQSEPKYADVDIKCSELDKLL